MFSKYRVLIVRNKLIKGTIIYLIMLFVIMHLFNYIMQTLQ